MRDKELAERLEALHQMDESERLDVLTRFIKELDYEQWHFLVQENMEVLVPASWAILEIVSKLTVAVGPTAAKMMNVEPVTTMINHLFVLGVQEGVKYERARRMVEDG